MPRLMQYTLIGVLTLALVGGVLAIGSGVAIQRRIVAPPSLEVGFGSFRLLAFKTNTPNCRTPGGAGVPNSFCVPPSVLVTGEYFAVWMLNRSYIRGVPIERANRLLIIRLDELDIRR